MSERDPRPLINVVAAAKLMIAGYGDDAPVEVAKQAVLAQGGSNFKLKQHWLGVLEAVQFILGAEQQS